MENTEIILEDSLAGNPWDLPVVKRGRPRKPKSLADEEKPKRQRGRPRKRTPQPKQPRNPKEVSIWRDDRNNYYRLYFHYRTKEETVCPHCNNVFDSRRLLNNHMNTSALCKIIREIKRNAEEQEPLNSLDSFNQVVKLD